MRCTFRTRAAGVFPPVPTRESCWLYENYGATPIAALTATTQPTEDLKAVA